MTYICFMTFPKRGSMNFNQAISLHSAWKQRMVRVLLGKDQRRSAERRGVMDHHRCALGQWIYGEGSQYALDPAFQALEEQHRLCHECADRVSNLMGQDCGSLELILLTGQFQTYSLDLMASLEELRRRYGLDGTHPSMVPAGLFREEDLPPRSGVPA